MVTVCLNIVLDDEALDLDAIGFVRALETSRRPWGGYTVVPNQGIGENKYLASIGGVRQRFHVTGHSGVEDDFTCHRFYGPEAAPFERSPVFQLKLDSGTDAARGPGEFQAWWRQQVIHGNTLPEGLQRRAQNL